MLGPVQEDEGLIGKLSMAESRIKGIRLAGISTVIPAAYRNIDEEREQFDLDAARLARLKREIGVNKRHVVTKNECASDLCLHAARLLISSLSCDPRTIDGLLLVTQTPDYFQPATSCVLHGKLDLSKSCAAFDINLGCSGYIYGLWLSSLMIAGGSCKRILLLAGDTLSRCVAPQDAAVAPLFGDAGTATIVERGEEKDCISFVLNSDGKGFNSLIIPAGAFRRPSTHETSVIKIREDGQERSEEHLFMNGAEIFTFSIREIPSLIKEVLALSGWQIEDVDYYIFHQANKFINQTIARKLGIPQQKAPIDVFEKYGNQSSASIPAVLSENLSAILKHTSLNLVLAGFGAGLSWAACALRTGPLACLPVAFLS